MGTFLVNFHARSKSVKKVTAALQDIPVEEGWIAGPHGGWVTFWEAEAAQQNTARIQSVAEHVSQSLDTAVIAFLVHDSDFLCYWLYDHGELLDEYNSAPGYFGDDEVDEEALAADCELLAKYCLPNTDRNQLEKCLVQWTRADVAEGITTEFAFAEERLSRIAPLLGMREEMLLTVYEDIGRDISAEELGASWIGNTEQPEHHSDDLQEERRAPIRPISECPLHNAAAKNDIAEIERLISNGADIDDVPHDLGITALAMAAGRGTVATVRKLVALGADLHMRGATGATPLRCAVQGMKVENIRTLVELGADIDEYDSQFGTLVHLALAQGHLDIATVLVEVGVDPETPNVKGETPLQYIQTQLSFLRSLQTSFGVANGPKQVVDQINKLQDLEQLMLDRRT